MVGWSDGDTVKVLTEQSCDFKIAGAANPVPGKAGGIAPENRNLYGFKGETGVVRSGSGRMIKVEQIDKDHRYGRLVANLYVDGKMGHA